MTDLTLHYETARSDAQGVYPPELQEAAYTAVDLAEAQGSTVWDVLRASGLTADERFHLARVWRGLGPGTEHEEFLP